MQFTIFLYRQTATSVTKSLETKHYPEFPQVSSPGIIKILFSHYVTTILQNRLNLYTLLKRLQQIASKRFPPCLCSIFLDAGERRTHPRVIHRWISRPWGSWSVNRRCHRQRGEDGRAFLLGEGRRTTWLSSLEDRQVGGEAKLIFTFITFAIKSVPNGRINWAKFT